MVEQTTSDMASEESKLSFFTKFSLVFSSPGKVFENVKIHPDWLLPILVILAVSITSAFLLKDLGIAAQKERIMQSERIPEAQKEVILDGMDEQAGSGLQTVMMFVGTIVYVVASFALVAALFWFSGNTILGGESSFIVLLSVYAWGYMAAIVEAIVKVPLALAKGSIHVYTSLAVLFDPAESQTVLFKIADAFDVFALWRVALWALGFAIVYRFSMGRSLAVVGTWYGIWIAVSIGFSTLMGGIFG